MEGGSEQTPGLCTCKARLGPTIPARKSLARTLRNRVEFRERSPNSHRSIGAAWAFASNATRNSRLPRFIFAALKQVPKAVVPRVLLSHALLQEGLDWNAAERALLDVITLEADNSKAQHNLAVLKKQRQRQAVQNDRPLPRLDRCEPYIAERSNLNVSLCMIVKNEEHNLPACLQSVADLMDEIIIVDTGSTDRTKEIAQATKVFDFPWVDSFAAAQIEACAMPMGDGFFGWMRMTASMRRIEAGSADSLLAFQASLVGYTMKCLCLADGKGVETVVDHLRLFPNLPQARWGFRVHEQILPSLRSLGVDVHGPMSSFTTPVIRIIGQGSASQSTICVCCNWNKPMRPIIPSHYSIWGVSIKSWAHGTGFANVWQSLAGSNPKDSIVRKLYALITQCHRTLGQKQEALAVCRKGLSIFADDIELLFQEGVALRKLGDTSGAIDCWERCLAMPAVEHFASINTGLRGHITRHNLAATYVEAQRLQNAESQWKAALSNGRNTSPLGAGCWNCSYSNVAGALPEDLRQEFGAAAGRECRET